MQHPATPRFELPGYVYVVALCVCSADQGEETKQYERPDTHFHSKLPV